MRDLMPVSAALAGLASDYWTGAVLLPGFRIEVAPWFNQPGGGIQYRIIGPDRNNAPVNDLLESGYLRDLHG
jgi:hypothetical protein